MSSGATEVMVPTLVGQTEASAVAMIEAQGLTVGTITVVSSANVPEGTVIASDPVANAKLPIGSVVNLVLSDGTVQIPDVRNLDVVEARNILTAPTIGYTVSIETLDGPTCAGQIGNIVLDQSVPAGQAPQMQSIILYVECIADPVVDPGTGN